MSGVRTSFGPFGYSTSENRYLLYPRRALKPNHGLRGLVFCHPWNGSAAGMYSSMYQRAIGYLLARNFVVCMSDLANNTWGNATGVQRVHQDRDYLINGWGCKSQVGLLGMSHGGTVAFKYAQTYPANVAFVMGLEPAVELSSVRAYTPDLATSIDASHGGFNSTINSTFSPALYADTLDATTPMSIWWAEDDPIVLPSTVSTFRQRRPQTKFVSIQQLSGLSAVGHNDEVTALCQDDMYKWSLNYAA